MILWQTQVKWLYCCEIVSKNFGKSKIIFLFVLVCGCPELLNVLRSTELNIEILSEKKMKENYSLIIATVTYLTVLNKCISFLLMIFAV